MHLDHWIALVVHWPASEENRAVVGEAQPLGEACLQISVPWEEVLEVLLVRWDVE